MDAVDEGETTRSRRGFPASEGSEEQQCCEGLAKEGELEAESSKADPTSKRPARRRIGELKKLYKGPANEEHARQKTKEAESSYEGPADVGLARWRTKKADSSYEGPTTKRLGRRRTREAESSNERRTRGLRNSKVKNDPAKSLPKGYGNRGGRPSPITLSKKSGEDEDIMEIDSPTQNLKRLLEEKTKNQSKGAAHGKRTREFTKASPSQTTPAEESAYVHLIKFKFWLDFEAIEKIAKEQGLEELFTDEINADRLTRGIPRKEAEELEIV